MLQQCKKLSQVEQFQYHFNVIPWKTQISFQYRIIFVWQEKQKLYIKNSF